MSEPELRGGMDPDEPVTTATLLRALLEFREDITDAIKRDTDRVVDMTTQQLAVMDNRMSALEQRVASSRTSSRLGTPTGTPTGASWRQLSDNRDSHTASSGVRLQSEQQFFPFSEYRGSELRRKSNRDSVTRQYAEDPEPEQLTKIVVQEDNSYKDIVWKDFTIDGFIRWLNLISDWEESAKGQKIEYLFNNISDKIKDTLLAALKEDRGMSRREIRQMTRAQLSAEVRKYLGPKTREHYLKLLKLSCSHYSVQMRSVDSYRKTYYQLLELKMLFIEREDFLYQSNPGLRPPLTSKPGGLFNIWYDLTPEATVGPIKRSLGSDRFDSIDDFFTKYCKELKVTLGLYESMVQFRQRFDFPKGSEQAKRLHMMCIGDDEDIVKAESNEDITQPVDTVAPVREDDEGIHVLNAFATPDTTRASGDKNSASGKPRVCESMLFNNSCKLPNCKFPHDKDSLAAARVWYRKAVASFQSPDISKSVDPERTNKPPWPGRPSAPGASNRSLSQLVTHSITESATKALPSDECNDEEDV